jgi:amino acid transporter
MTSIARTKAEGQGTRGTLGTFAGVFTPSVLTILGIILFLRLGFVVGNAGLGRALVIIGLANAISVLTSISLSAIATNLRVKGGGPYYIISRTLGGEFGGAIGIVLFLAQSVSIAFYCIGFGEAVSTLLPETSARLPQLVAALAVALLFIFAWLGADWATRFQYLVMVALVLSLGSFFAGGLLHWDAAVLARNWSSPDNSLPFWAVFAIFFPAVTGFTQGVSMSGDLKDPGKSLPVGTFLAVGISIVVYLGAAVVFAGALPLSELMADYGAMKRVAGVGFLIDVGVIAATLSSAMASFLGAPRILQSTAQDRIFPFLLPFAEGSGPAENPRRGVLLSAGIAGATIALGNLNLVARVVSMFFLISYGLLNYATYYEARAASPSFRPRFRWFDLRLSLVGGLLCLGSMLALDLAAGVVAIAVLFAIYQYLKRTAGPARWADSRRSYHLQQVREHLLASAAETEHPRDWRPQLLAFSNHAERREQLLRFASWLEGGSGLTTAVRILEGHGVKMLKLRRDAEDELRKDLAVHDLSSFPLVVTAPRLEVGISTLVQSFGVGPLKANTVLLNWLDEHQNSTTVSGELRYGRHLRVAFRLGCNVVVLAAEEGDWTALENVPPKDRRIDVWWWGDTTSHLMLLLAYLVTRGDAWDGATIRVLAPGFETTEGEPLEVLHKTLEDARIAAESEIVEDATSDSIVERSKDSALVFLPLRLQKNQPLGPFGGRLEDLLPRLPIAALVMAAMDIELDAEPEEGAAAEIAAAVDAVTDAQKKARAAEDEAAQAVAEAEGKLAEMRAAAASGVDEEGLGKIEREVAETQEQARKAARRAAKATAKVETAEREAEALGAKLPETEKEAGESEPPSDSEKNGGATGQTQ